MGSLEKQLITILQSIEGRGSFNTSGIKNFTLPGLEIEGLGEIGFPVGAIQTEAIIAHAKQAPFGKGSQTVTDTSVRNTWEIDARQITFKNKNWQKFLNGIVKKVKKGLGIKKKTITPSLYKLLIYKEGGFFLPHKDSEKEPGMFASLVIGLPSAHTGGELHIRFEDKEEVVDFSEAASSYQIPFVAFYADCDHEIKPVTSGYRVCLVYNLLQEPNGTVLTGPKFKSQIEEMEDLLKKWAPSINRPPKAILLGHQYTPTNFSLEKLKHHDLPRAKALLDAAEKSDYFAALGLVTHYMMGNWEGVGFDYGYNSRYNNYKNEEKTDEEGTMGEVFEAYTTIEHWSKVDGPTLGEILLEEGTILTNIEIGEGKPIQQEGEGFTGNAGMTLQYWYHYGAVILWPKSKHINLLLNRPLYARLLWLQYYQENWNNLELKADEYSRKLISHFSDKELERKEFSNANFSGVAGALAKLNDEKFLALNKERILLPMFDKIEIKQWINLLKTYPAKSFSQIFQKAADLGEASILLQILEILNELIKKTLPSPNSFEYEQIQKLPNYLKTVQLEKIQGSTYSYYPNRPSQKKIIKKIIKNLIKLSPIVEANMDYGWVKKILKSITKSMTRDYVNEVLIAILIKNKHENNALADAIKKASLENLMNRVNNKPKPPENWTRAVPETPYAPEIWELLTPFLTSPTQKVFDYVKNEWYRRSMENAINAVAIDLKMETIRRGSPYTLRLTKTQDAFQRSLNKWKKDVKLLEKFKQH